MKQCSYRLLALLSILILMTATTAAFAEEGKVNGHVEIGLSGMDIKDSPARVNEYVKTSNIKDDEDITLNPALDLGVEYVGETAALDLSANVKGNNNLDFSLGADIGRIFKIELEQSALEHWKDHDLLEHLGATMFGDVAGEQPRLTTDATVGQVGVDTPAEANERYQQELDNDYIVTRKETKANADLTIPALPNVTFHTGMRIEQRDGLEQARTLSKCNQCHVQANGKEISERTEDFTLGATGKFGPVTVEYEFLSRNFNDDSVNPDYNYLSSGATHAGVVDSAVLNYSGEESYANTPESEKTSHSLKARYDIDASSSVTAAYVNAEVESNVIPDSSYTISTDTLTSDFESFFLKGATKIAGLRLSVRGGTYTIDGPEYVVTFPGVAGVSTLDLEANGFNADGTKNYQSAESRDVNEFGLDAVYRLAAGTTLRFGLEYEEIDRDEAELADTETFTGKIALKSRLNKQLSGRVSYKYQNIDEPFTGAAVGIAQVTGDTDALYPGMAWLTTADYRFNSGLPTANPYNNPGVYYWNSVYPNRELESSMSPEDVHEAKLSATWAPNANMAATFFVRGRMEENGNVEYKKDTYVPGISFYYAPNSKMNLTMAYTFNKMKTENRMCVGWYHG